MRQEDSSSNTFYFTAYPVVYRYAGVAQCQFPMWRKEGMICREELEKEEKGGCGKTRHKNVNVDLGGNGFIAIAVYNFSHFIIHNSD